MFYKGGEMTRQELLTREPVFEFSYAGSADEDFFGRRNLQNNG
jgi:hypothetical protein